MIRSKQQITICPECANKVILVRGRLSIFGHHPGCKMPGLEPDKYVEESGRKPYPYQKKEILRACDLEDLNLGLFWQMRLGKTLTSIKIAKKKGYKKVLVVCPKAVTHTWKDELHQEEYPDSKVHIIESSHGDMFVPLMKKVEESWWIANYEACIRIPLETVDWDLVILDETHKIKDPSTKISKKMANEYTDVPAKLALSGTPAPETVIDYFQTLKFLYGSFIGCDDYYSFRNRFFESNGSGKYTPKYNMRDLIANHLAKYCSVLQREHVGVGGKTIHQQRFVSLPPDFEDYYRQLERTWVNKDYEAKYAIQVYQQLHQLSGGYPKKEEALRSDHKIKETLNLLKNDLRGEQVVIWTKFTTEQKALAEQINGGSKFALINGQVSVPERHRLRKAFNAGKYQYLLCTNDCGSLGLDMSGADTAIVVSNSLGATTRSQMLDRLIHPEKKTTSLIIDITCKDTICEDVRDLVMNKVDDQDKMLKSIYQKAKERSERK